MEEIASALSLPLSSQTLAGRSLAYASLLDLQHQCEGDASFYAQSASLVPRILSDASVGDEEIAAQALKCLGFMIYHPSIVTLISEETVHMVLLSLAKLITTTKMKAICNLGIWCISIQQIDASIVDPTLISLLKAIVYAMENPFGSLSILYEAIQAVVKLASQLCASIKETSYIWAPSIYGRLASADRKEREMAERCLLKLEHVIFPPASSLSEAVATDLKQKLITRLYEMLQDSSQMTSAIQAWRWYIRLLARGALKRRNLVNMMLKVFEKGFLGTPTCTQAASLVAWEVLIDALVPDKGDDAGMSKTEYCNAPDISRELSLPDSINDGVLGRIDLLMKPILRTFLSESPMSLYLCSIKTWYHLLHRLGLLVNHPSVKAIVIDPVLESVFSKECDGKNTWLWDACTNLLDDYCLSKLQDRGSFSNMKKNACNISGNNVSTLSFGGEGLWNMPLIKWLPWEYNDMGYFIKIIRRVVFQALKLNMSSKCRDFAFNSALRIFKSLLKGIQVEMKKELDVCSNKQSCIKAVMQFMKHLFEDLASVPILVADTLLCSACQFVEAIRDELEPSILVSPLYMVALDVNYIKDMQCMNDCKYQKAQVVRSFEYMDMVLPIVYLDVTFHFMIFNFLRSASYFDSTLKAMHLSTSLFFSVNPCLHLNVIVSLMYMYWKEVMPTHKCQVELWMVIAENLNIHLNRDNDTGFLNGKEVHDGDISLLQSFISYPISMCHLPDMHLVLPKVGDDSTAFPEEELYLETFFKLWRSILHSSLCALHSRSSVAGNYVERLCEYLEEVISENIALIQCILDIEIKKKMQNFFILAVFDEIADCMLRASRDFQGGVPDSESIKQDNATLRKNNFIKASTDLICRFLRLSLKVCRANQAAQLMVAARVFDDLANIVGCLKSKQYTELLIEGISDPLTELLSSFASIQGNVQYAGIVDKLQLFWKHMLEHLQQSDPPLIFDSHLLRHLAPLLQSTLDHSYQPISDVTIAFWNNTFGKGKNLCYPDCLLPTLERFHRKGLMNVPQGDILLPKYTPLYNNASRKGSLGELVLPRKSKDVRVCEDAWNGFDCVNVEPHGPRSKRLKLSEHPKSLNRAQYRKIVSCRALGPDWGSLSHFPNGSGVLRKVNNIMDMLRR